MSETISVRAIRGKMLPDPERPRQFIGYAEVRDASAKADHEIPGGRRYAVRREPVDVPNNIYFRNALRAGDIQLATEDAAKIAVKSRAGD